MSRQKIPGILKEIIVVLLTHTQAAVKTERKEKLMEAPATSEEVDRVPVNWPRAHTKYGFYHRKSDLWGQSSEALFCTGLSILFDETL